MNAQCIMVCSGKGGTGKSTVSVLLGACLARLGRKTLLVELDSGLRSVDIIAGVYGRTVYDIEDVLCGRCEGAKAVVPSPLYPGLSVISAPYEGGAVEAAPLGRLLTAMRPYFDFILLDTAAGMGAPFTAASTVADKALLVLTERKTRQEIIVLIPNRKAETIVKALDALERKFGAVNFRKIFRSITVDNGSEFAAAEELERSAVNKAIPRTKVYFCHPYSSWERGSNENVNGMIRRKHPKGTDFSKVSAAEIARTEAWVNSYPRKILGYMSSEIMFRQCLRELGIAA